MSGLAQASRIQNTKDLQAAKAKQQVREAQTAAAVKVGTTLFKQGAQNLGSGSSLFGGTTYATDADGNRVAATEANPDKKNTLSERFKMGAYG